ncbi:hypothetical protein Bbelb_401730 [Branchiostoma belcheri]|nr:hypothetical protein Bbelb_401730 [Branchiostoma belcheri]
METATKGIEGIVDTSWPQAGPKRGGTILAPQRAVNRTRPPPGPLPRPLMLVLHAMTCTERPRTEAALPPSPHLCCVVRERCAVMLSVYTRLLPASKRLIGSRLSGALNCKPRVNNSAEWLR